MAVVMDTENELMSSLTQRRSELRNSFKLKPIHHQSEETYDVNDSLTTSLGSTAKDNLMASLRERRLKRKTLLLPPISADSEGADQQHDTSTLLQSQDDKTDQKENNEPTGTRRLKSLRSRMRQTRFDAQSPPNQDQLLDSSSPATVSTIPIQKSTHRWRLLSAQLGDIKRKTIEQQGVDFFTASLDDEDSSQYEHTLQYPTLSREQQEDHRLPLEESDGPPTAGQSNEEDEQPQEQEEERSTLLGISNQFGEGEASSQPQSVVYEYQVPSYTPYRLRVSREKEVYFVPEQTPAPPEHKTPGNAPPVYLEESGMFIGDRPKVSPTNQAIMENRLLKRPDGGAQWFGTDGLLKVQLSPLASLVTRPLILGYKENTQVLYKQLPKLGNFNRYLIRSTKDKQKYQIEFDIGQLQFSHHPLFSAEHVLASDLIGQCRQYESIDRHKIVDHLRQKYSAMEYTVHSVQQSLPEMDSNDETAIEMKSQLELYQNEMKSVRHQIKQLERAEYRSVRNILETWQQIKAVRDRLGYTCTNVQIIVRRVATDLRKDESNWEKDIMAELNDQQAEFDAINGKMAVAYENELAQWKDYERKRRRALRRLRDRESATPMTTEDAVNQSGNEAQHSHPSTTESSSVPPEKPRPVAPPIFNIEEKKREIIEGYRKIYRKPGEPILIPQLTFNQPITQQCIREELVRRNEVSASRYRLKILYNDKEICSTRDCQLNSDFTVNFNQQLKVEVIEWPVAIALQVLNTSSLLPSTLAQVFIPIPDQSCTTSSTSANSYQFSSTHKVNYTNHTGVGAGYSNHPLLPSDRGVLVTGGKISVGVCWSEDIEGRSMCPPMMNNKGNKRSGPDIRGIHDPRKIKQWIDEVGLDPNDPRNFELLDLAKSVTDSMENATYFRLQSMDDVERFVSDEEFARNKRLTLLQLREQGHPALKGKCIPLDDGGVTDSVWKAVQEYKPYALSDLPVTIFGGFYDEQKKERERYLMEIREKLLSRSGKRLAHNKLTLEDVIHEEFIPNVSSFKETILQFLSPNRPLRPRRKPYHKPVRQNTHVDDCHICVRVMRAINIPLRNLGTSRGTHAPGGDTLTDQQKNLVRPFIEVSFGSEHERTTTGHGPHPHWNDEIIIPFHPPEGDFSPTALQRITDELRFDLYDETTHDLLQDERQRETDFHKRVEKKWLGVLAIPFSTLHYQSRIEGTFQVNTPPILIGYHQQSNTLATENVYIQVFVAVEPSLGVLPPLTEKFECDEDYQLLSKATSWLKTLREKYPKRNYQASVLDASGKKVFLTRFILPQNPPAEILPSEYRNLRGKILLQCMEKLAWFVSLIPFLPDAVLFSGTCDVWTTSSQFLRMLGGDEEEHAVLLCNYFLHIGQDAWVVLGHAIPEGATAYVLTYNPLDVSAGGYMLWDPTTGRHYLNTESYLPLISIGTIANRNNIWGNIQEWDHPERMDFNFHNSSSWSPLFSASMEPLPSLQVETLRYTPANIEPIELLQSRIEQIIYSHIDSLRVRHITRWNRYCSRKLHDALKRFEETPFVSPETRSQHQLDILETYPGYSIHGYPLSLRCSNTKELVKAIERTGFHQCEHERVEFGLGVYIHPYPNSILSMWIYLMTLIPNN